MSTLQIGSVNLNSREDYRWRQLPQKKNYSLRVRDWRGRDSSRLTYRKLTSITLEFEIACLGDDMDAARENEAAIESMLDDAAEWSINRTSPGFVGTEVIFTESAGGETPRSFSVLHGVWEEHDQGLWGLEAPQIHGHLSLTLVPYVSGVAPYPVRFRFFTPEPFVEGAPAFITPNPVAFTLAVPAPVVAFIVHLFPDPVTFPFSIPIPSGVDNGTPRLVTPNPVAFPLVVTAPSIANGPPLVMTPDPVTYPLAVPVPNVDNGAALVTTNLLVDYDINALALSDGADITTMSDASGNGHHATGMTSHKPVYHLDGGSPNSKGYAHFNGSQIAGTVDNDVLPTGTAERVVFAIAKRDAQTAADQGFFQTGASGTGGGFFAFGSAGAANNRIQGTFWSLSTSTFTVSAIDTWHAYAIQINAAGNPVVWIDGVKQSIDTGVHPNTSTGKPLYIGGRGDPWFDSPDGDFEGGIARVTGHGALSDGQIAAQFAYFRGLYGTP